MIKIKSVLLYLLIAAVLGGCASPGPTDETSRGLVGAWIVTASRPAGVGKNLLTFSSDGTFFRSGVSWSGFFGQETGVHKWESALGYVHAAACFCGRVLK